MKNLLIFIVCGMVSDVTTCYFLGIVLKLSTSIYDYIKYFLKKDY